MDDAGSDVCIRIHGSPERTQGLCHLGHDGFRGFALHHPEAASIFREEEIDLQTLLVPKVVELFPLAPVDLVFDNLSGNRALEERTKEGGAV